MNSGINGYVFNIQHFYFRNIEKLGIKQSIMRLISNEDSEVRYFALNTVQKYMSNLWSAI